MLRREKLDGVFCWLLKHLKGCLRLEWVFEKLKLKLNFVLKESLASNGRYAKKQKPHH